MDLNELIVLKQSKTTELTKLIEVGQLEKRELNTDEITTFSFVWLITRRFLVGDPTEVKSVSNVIVSDEKWRMALEDEFIFSFSQA